MCGLSVYVSSYPGSGRPDLAQVSAFSKALEDIHHRGPDETSVVPADGALYGFKRLAIIDLSTSHQPLSYPPAGPDAGRWTIVFNGEIYNYRELRDELIAQFDAQFATQGDTEVLAAAYYYWGAAALPKLRGMFAFVLRDSVTGTMHAVRDGFGIKPLYYLQTADGLYLASEKKCLLPFTDAAAGVNTEALSHYLTYQYVPEPITLHPQIMRLQPGRLLTWTPGAGEPTIERWFRPDMRTVPVDAATAQRRIIDALRDSVRAHLHADVPVGAFLSSGIDSTATVALAREIDPSIRAFTAGFDFNGYSEIEIAEQTARHLGVELTPTVVTEDDVMATLPQIIWHLDDPVADPSLVPLYFLAQTAARYVTVVISGEGADELFGGYTIYREPASLATLSRLPNPMQRGLRGLSAIIPEGVKGKSFIDRGTTPLEERYYGNARIFTVEEKTQLMRTAPVPHTRVTAPVYAETADLDDVATMQYVDLHTWLPGDILTKADRMSMAHSLELRVPFLDNVVWAAAASLPTELKLPAGSRSTKQVLRDAVRSVVPDFVVDRAKLGFPTPTRVWLKGRIGEWAAEVFAASQAGHLIDLNYAQSLLAAHRRGEGDYSRKVWAVLAFCLWHAIEVEGSIPIDARRP